MAFLRPRYGLCFLLLCLCFHLGAKVEKCVYAILGRVQSDEKQLQWSAEAFAGAQYRLGRRTCLYFQPELSYYFTRTELVTCRTEHPLNVSLHAGLRFEL